MVIYKCQCGKTELAQHQHPFDCQTCSFCGSKIIGPNETYDEPMEHATVQRHDPEVLQCKRCGEIING